MMNKNTIVVVAVLTGITLAIVVGSGRAEDRVSAEGEQVDKVYTCVGIDGTKGGWIAACVKAGVVEVKMFAAIDKLCEEYSDADSVIIDIPIGLPERKTDIRPDGELRKRLRGKASSVFTTPCRQAVYIEEKQDAKEMNVKVLGKSLSEQSLAICGKMKEVDEFLQKNEAWKNRLVESHPEFVFMVLNDGKSVAESKKIKEGYDARVAILRQHTQNIDQLLEELARQPGMKKRMDDILDAICLAVIGDLGMKHGFRTIPESPATDSRGLKMQIVYATMK